MLLVAGLVALALLAAWFVQTTIPRRIVSRPAVDGVYHALAQRYREILAEDGVTVEERLTDGAGENAGCCATRLRRRRGVHVQGGVVRPPSAATW